MKLRLPRLKDHKNVRYLKNLLREVYETTSPDTQQTVGRLTRRSRTLSQRIRSGIKARSPRGREHLKRRLIGEVGTVREFITRETLPPVNTDIPPKPRRRR